MGGLGGGGNGDGGRWWSLVSVGKEAGRLAKSRAQPDRAHPSLQSDKETWLGADRRRINASPKER